MSDYVPFENIVDEYHEIGPLIFGKRDQTLVVDADPSSGTEHPRATTEERTDRENGPANTTLAVLDVISDSVILAKAAAFKLDKCRAFQGKTHSGEIGNQ